VIWLAALLLAVQPHLGDLRKDGFTVLFETDTEAEIAVEVSRRAGAGWGEWKKAGASKGTRHRVRLGGLEPREHVHWRIVGGGEVLAESESDTAPPDDAAGLDFLVYGDTRNGEEVARLVAIAGVGGGAILALSTGDMVPTGDDDQAWVRLFEVEQPLLGRVPMYLAPGNHDFYRDTDGSRIRRFFAMPDGGISYYTFRVGPARFIALDSNRPDPEQTAWLAKTLEEAAREPGRPHVFVFMHHPPFSTGGHCGAAIEQAEWVRLFERWKPSAVFGGHDHAYERLERNDVRYFVTGGGGAPVYAERERCPEHDRLARRVYRAEHHLLRVRLRGEAIEIEVARPQGQPIETVRWSRGDPTSPSGTPELPELRDERKATGLARPLVTTMAVAVLVGLLVLLARRRT
jgi:hypothetical protein